MAAAAADVVFRSRHHRHELKLQVPEGDQYGNGWNCDQCERVGAPEAEVYHCSSCEFDMCSDCVARERQRGRTPKRGRRPRSSARMLIPHNGRVGFDLIKPSLGMQRPPKEVLKSMIKREAELRRSDETQRAFDAHGLDESRNFSLLQGIQTKVLSEFGYDDVNILRTALSLYPNDQALTNEIRELAFWMKYNRAKQGNLNVGDVVPDLVLSDLTGQDVRLSDWYEATCGVAMGSGGPPLVLVAGSVS
mmetsp:Transcript_7191/g.8111  ORF Transcript_7191/g.8111 Transcript_7191/m.8111 type:complete len:248 (-) Transcript_7191:376-1119(-)